MTTYRGGSGWSGASWPTNTGSGDTTTWIYHEATGLLTNKLYADGNGTIYEYTSDGRLSKRTWARGDTTDCSYNPDTGEMTNVNYSGSTPDILFMYNRIGQRKEITDAQGTRTFVYNTSLQLESETIVASGVTNVITRSYATNGVIGRNTGLDLNSTYDIDYGFDNLGRFSSLSSVINSTTNTFAYNYLANTDLISGMSNSILKATRSFEANRNLITQVLNQTNGATLSQYDYSNDVLGRRTKRIDTLTAITTNDFAYNDRSELIDADMGTNVYDYVFDNIGNRKSTTNNAEVLTYLANQLNQYTNIADGVSNAPTYDLDGNMLTYGGWTFTWNSENRLVSASNGSTVVSFVCDYMGRRVSKTTNGVTISFLYDGWNMIRETSISETNLYVWGPDLSGRLQGAGGIGGLLSRTTSSGDVHLYCFDANGNVMQMVDASDSSVDAEYEYDPFGNIIKQTGGVAGDNMFRFSTRYFDDETGLLYYGYRYYSSELGRWLNRDPIEELGGFNLYLMTGNNPINRMDLLGLADVKNDTGGTLVTISSFDFDLKIKDDEGCCVDDSEEKVSAVPLPLAAGNDTGDLEWGDVDAIIGTDGTPYKTGGSKEIEAGEPTGGDFTYSDEGGFGGTGEKPTSDFWSGGGDIKSRADDAITQLEDIKETAEECSEENESVISLIERLIRDVQTAKEALGSSPYDIE